MKDLGQLKYSLGIKVTRSKKGIFLSQQNYALEVLEDVGYFRAKLASFPKKQNLSLIKFKGEYVSDPSSYHTACGKVSLLDCHTF